MSESKSGFMNKSNLQVKYTKYILIVFGIYFILGMRFLIDAYGDEGIRVPGNAMAWCFGVLIITVGIKFIAEGKKLKVSFFSKILIVVFILFLIPFLYPLGFKIHALGRILGFLGGILIFIILHQLRLSRSQKDLILLFIVISGLLEALVGLLQIYIFNYENNLLMYPYNYGRPLGTMFQVNGLANLMSTSIILAGFLFIKNTSLQKEMKFLNIFLLISVFFCSWTLWLCLSRSGYLGGALALLLLTPWAFKINIKKYILFIVVIGLGLLSNSVTDHNVNQIDKKITKAGARKSIYINSAHMFLNKPLTGYGYGGFESGFLKNQSEMIKEDSSVEAFPEMVFLTHPHNEILFWITEGGIVPLLGIILLIIGFITMIRRFNFTTALAYASLVLPIGLYSELELAFYVSSSLFIIFMILLFVIDSDGIQEQNKEMKEINMKYAYLLSPISQVVLIVTLGYMLTTIHTAYKIRQNKPWEIVNPIAFLDEIYDNSRYKNMVSGYLAGNNQPIKLYLKETKVLLERKPREHYYRGMIKGYNALGETQKAKEWLNKARLLFINEGHKKIFAKDASEYQLVNLPSKQK